MLTRTCMMPYKYRCCV